MKKITLLFSMVLMAHVSQAQDCTPGTSYSQNFEGVTVPALPECTALVNAGTGNNWVTVNNPGNGFTSKTLQYTSNANAADAWFFTKGVQIIAGTYYKVSYRYGNNSATTTEKLKVTFGSAPTVAGVTSNFADHPAVTGGEAVLANVDFFNAPTTGVYYFGFNAYSIAGQGNLYVDDFTIEPLTCGLPSELTASAITSNSATISWLPPTTGNSSTISVYQYAAVTTGTPPADGTYNPGPSVDLTDLTPGTTYFVFARTLCGPVWSDWSEPVIFTPPPCASTTVPYTQDFESATVPGIPDCTVAINTGTGNNWVTTNNPGNDFTSKTLQYSGNANPADAWFFTQGIELTAGTYYKVSYKFGNNSATTTESLKVTFGTNPSPSFVTSNIADHPAVIEGAAASFGVDFFNVEESGAYYFGFNAYSEASQSNLYVDDFSIEVLECGIPHNLSVTDISEGLATLEWEDPVTGNSDTITVYQVAVTETNEEPQESQIVSVPALSVMTAVEPGTTYYVYVRTQCGPIWSDWVMISFTTDELSIGENNFKGFNYHPNPVTNILTLENATEIEKVEVYNITGQLILQQSNTTQAAAINMSSLAGGAYFVTVYSGNETKRLKVIKQ